MKACSHCSVSACVLVLVAAIVQLKQGYPDPFSVSFLLMAVTTVIHHSRQDKWWYYDIWRLLDYIAIVAFGICALSRCIKESQLKYWLCMCVTSLVIVSSIWGERIPVHLYSFTHSLVHYVVALSVLVMSCEFLTDA